MPLVKVEQPVEEKDDDVSKLIFKDDGSLTLEGEILAIFLESVDFNTVYDDPEVREAGLVTSKKLKVVEQDGIFIEAEDGDKKAIEVNVESIAPEDMAELVDIDDLVMMFEYYVENEMPSETLEDKARLAAASAMLDLGEARKKKDFKRYYGNTAKGYSRKAVNRMLGAMIFKGAIDRAEKPGSGYDGGDYKKHPGGYGQGTAAGIKSWMKVSGRATGKVKAKYVAASKKAGMSMKAKKAAAAKKGAAAKLKGKKSKKGAAISASAEQTPAKLTEGANLASKMIGKMHESSLPPKTVDEKK